MKLILLPEAESDLVAAALWYDERQSGLGTDFLFELESALKTVEEHAENLPLLEDHSGPYEVR